MPDLDPQREADGAHDARSREAHEEERQTHRDAADLHAQAADLQDEHVRHAEEAERRRD